MRSTQSRAIGSYFLTRYSGKNGMTSWIVEGTSYDHAISLDGHLPGLEQIDTLTFARIQSAPWYGTPMLISVWVLKKTPEIQSHWFHPSIRQHSRNDKVGFKNGWRDTHCPFSIDGQPTSGPNQSLCTNPGYFRWSNRPFSGHVGDEVPASVWQSWTPDNRGRDRFHLSNPWGERINYKDRPIINVMDAKGLCFIHNQGVAHRYVPRYTFH